MAWLIYKHTNILNGKCYIGQTCRKPNDRWQNGTAYNRTFKFGKAIDKYGWENFRHEIIEENILTKKDANEREIFYISLYDSYQSGYNSTKGGCDGEYLGNEILQISIDRNIIKKYPSSAEAERETGILAQNIGACLLGQQVTAGGYYWVGADVDIKTWIPPKSRKEKPIICVENQKVFNSVTQASEEMGISISGISKCVMRMAITAGGYHWCYLYEYDDDWEAVITKKIGGYNSRPILCVETGETYESITECSILTGILTQNLSQNCCKSRRTAKGKHYAYLDEYDENWKPAEEYNKQKRRVRSTRRKAVYCYELNEVFMSSCEASEKLGIDNRLICRCCSGELIKTHGYHFWYAVGNYEDKKPRESRQGQKGKKNIICIETGEFFHTAIQASKIKNISVSSLSACLSGKKQTAGGYHWRYAE